MTQDVTCGYNEDIHEYDPTIEDQVLFHYQYYNLFFSKQLFLITYLMLRSIRPSGDQVWDYLHVLKLYLKLYLLRCLYCHLAISITEGVFS